MVCRACLARDTKGSLLIRLPDDLHVAQTCDGVHDEVVAVVPTATTAERNVLHGALPAVPVQAIPHRRAGYTVARVVVQLECH